MKLRDANGTATDVEGILKEIERDERHELEEQMNMKMEE